MGVDKQRAEAESSSGVAASSPIGPLAAALAQTDEPDRYRLLAELLSELAEQSRVRGNGRKGGAADEAGKLSKKVQTLLEDKAHLADKLAAATADVEHRSRQFEAEQTRGRDLQSITEEQRDRLEALQKNIQTIETQLEARNADLHKAHVENDDLLLKLQRAEERGLDHSKTDRLEESKRDLGAENESLRGQLEQLRVDKDAVIARLNEELAAAHTGAPSGADIEFVTLWQRLASCKPALVEGHVEPNVQAAERLIDTFIELVRFVDDFDRLIRPFLTQYVRDHPPVKVPWDVYAKRGGARETVQQILAPVGGKPAGILRVKLRGLYKWIEAAMIGCDAAIESVSSELETFVRHSEPFGMGSDPNRKIKEFIRESGPDLFLQHIRELRGSKIADVFGRGG